MFGKKKDEEWEYIGNSFDGTQTEESISDKKNGYAYKLFMNYLDDDEKILFVSGNGKVDGGYGSKDSNKKGLQAFLISSAALIGLLVPLFLAAKLPLSGVLIMTALLGIPGIAILSIIIWIALGGLTGSANYAVTDKRVLALIQNNWQEISLKDVKNTAIRNGVITVMSVYGNMIAIYYTSDTMMAKAILDDAVRKCRSDQYK